VPEGRNRSLAYLARGDFHRRIARSGGNVAQPDYVLADPIMTHEAKRRARSGEIWIAVTKHDRVKVNSILIDQAEFGEAVRQDRTGNFNLPLLRRFQLADCGLKIAANKLGIGAD
jgi:hypothetical protein